MLNQYYTIIILIILFIYIKSQLIILSILAILGLIGYYLYKKKLEKFIDYDAYDIQPGEKCKNDYSCDKDSNCKYINKKYGKVCTVGRDGIHPVSANLDNGHKHYLPVNIESCNENDSKLKCPPHHKCVNNKCKKLLYIKRKWIKNYYDEDNPELFKWELEKSIYSKSKPLFFEKKVKLDRMELIPPVEDDVIERCPPTHTSFYDKNKLYCKDNEDEKNICRLDINGNRKYELCSSISCPKNYLYKNNLCEHKNEPEKKCKLDPLFDSTYPVCGDFNSYIPFKNFDIKDNSLNSLTNVDKEICEYECNKNKDCDSYVTTNNKNDVNCQLKTIPTSTLELKENDKKKTYFKNPLNYSFYDNTNVNDFTIESYDIETPSSCAQKCDTNINCNGFTLNKEILKCELKSKINNKNTSGNKNHVLFKKKYKRGKLCPIFYNNDIQDEIYN